MKQIIEEHIEAYRVVVTEEATKTCKRQGLDVAIARLSYELRNQTATLTNLEWAGGQPYRVTQYKEQIAFLESLIESLKKEADAR